MDQRQYVSRKVLLLEEAGIFDEDQQVKTIWRGLDAQLMAMASPLSGGGNTIKGFTEKLYQHEYAAKRLWRETQRPVAVPRPRAREPLNQPKDTPIRYGFIEREADKTEMKSTPARRLTFPRQRERDCRHCGGPHMDFHCPSRPPADRRPVRAYLLEPGIPDDKRMVQLEYADHDPDLDRKHTDFEAEEQSDEEQGNNRRSRVKVDAAKDK